MRVFFILMMVGFIYPTIIFSQGNNRISIQTGLFHSFFDKTTPYLNVNYRDKNKMPYQRNLFFNSYEIQYQRKIDSLNAISIEGSYYFYGYMSVSNKLLKRVYSDRGFYTINSSYKRSLNINDKFNFTYGGGLNLRFGNEGIIITYADLGSMPNAEILMESRQLLDFGLNARTGIEYSPIKWLTLYSEFDLIGFIYVHDKKQIELIRDFYGFKGYPKKFDLSWRFGIGFNFGK